ncbi:HD domain-containing protein [Enterococcus italicus]|uniref:HD domain-containing protein n=1 Tax=Enterococcus italicus TaxID=246144 RepID=UPI003FA24E36
MNLYDKALVIAEKAHKGQVDKAGKDYIEHPLFVASLVNSEEEKATALLHDVIEDSSYTFDDLLNAGIPTDVVEAVSLLTKPRDVSYQVYLDGIKKNHIARIVKLADLTHNSDLSRLPDISEKDIERQEKYKRAIEYLK